MYWGAKDNLAQGAIPARNATGHFQQTALQQQRLGNKIK